MRATTKRRLALSVAAILAVPGVGRLRPASAQKVPFAPVTDAVLQRPDASDWLRWRRDHGATGYSPLDQINQQNVQKLRLSTWRSR